MATYRIYGFFVASKVGKSGLTDVTVDVYSVNRATSAISAVVTGAATFAVGGGLYGYAITDPAFPTLDYLGIFKTADATVDAQHVAALRIEYEDAKLGTALVADGAVWQLTANALELAPAAPAMISSQAVRDAMKLAPTAGDSATGSVDKHLDDAALEATLTAIKGASWSSETLKAIKDAVDLRLLTTAYSTPPTAAVIADAVLDEAGGTHAGLIPTNLDAKVSTRITLGAGAVSKTLTIDDGTNPLDGVAVWVTSDVAGTNAVASGTTDSLGHVTFMLDAGTYWVWCQLAGTTFSNPVAVVWA